MHQKKTLQNAANIVGHEPMFRPGHGHVRVLKDENAIVTGSIDFMWHASAALAGVWARLRWLSRHRPPASLPRGAGKWSCARRAIPRRFASGAGRCSGVAVGRHGASALRRVGTARCGGLGGRAVQRAVARSASLAAGARPRVGGRSRSELFDALARARRTSIGRPRRT